MTDKIKLAGGDLTLEAPLGKTSVYRFSVEEVSTSPNMAVLSIEPVSSSLIAQLLRFQ